MNVGIDLVNIPEFRKRVEKLYLEKLFVPIELMQNTRTESLAGIFAAKEAFFKVIGRNDDLRCVWIEKEKSGAPMLYNTLLNNDKKIRVSISHDGDYAIAIVILE